MNSANEKPAAPRVLDESEIVTVSGGCDTLPPLPKDKEKAKTTEKTTMDPYIRG